jgi:Zn-dependent protease with chaperone function
MGYLLHIVLALAALGLSESGVSTGWRSTPLLIASCAVPHVLGALARTTFMRGKFASSQLAFRALHGCAPALYFAALAVFGWRETVSELVGREISLFDWPHLGLLLVGAPFVVFELLAIDARARTSGSPHAETTRWRNFQARMFASSILPVAAYVAIASTVGWSESLRIHIEEVGLYGGAFAALLLAVMALALPTILRNTWDTTPLAPGLQRDVCLEVARRAGFRCRSLLVWNTGHLTANAAIIGVSARSRVVVFSDALLAQLDLRELAAVFAHEIGHAARRHVPLFIVWALAFFMSADLVAQRVFPEDEWLSAATVVVVMAIWFVLFSFVSRRCELEADLYSLELLGDRGALVGALERVGGRLRDVASWRHFSISDRVRFLDRSAEDPSVARRLHGQLRAWMWLGCALLALTAGLQLHSMWRTFDRDRIEVDLRLGRYAAASSIASRSPDLEADVRALVDRAATLHEASQGKAVFEREARAALRRGDVDAAVEWLTLGGLRGESDLAAIGEALTAADVDPRDLVSPELYRAWEDDLAAALASGTRR